MRVVGLILLALLFGLIFGLQDGRTAEPIPVTASISTFASYLTGQTTVVTCETQAVMVDDSGQDRDGFVEWNPETGAVPHIYLKRRVCANVIRVFEHRLRSDIATGADDLETLLHEAAHVRLNSLDEGLVECAALRGMKGALRLLGYSFKARAMLTEQAWIMHTLMPDAYQTRC